MQLSMNQATRDRERRRRRNRKLVIGFFGFLGVVAILESPLTRIRSFSVTGNTTIPGTELITESGLVRGMSLWQVNASAIGNSIRQHEPLIDDVSVHTDYLTGAVQLSVTEKHIVAIYQENQQFYNLLSDGEVLGAENSTSGFPFPLVTTDTSRKVQVGHVVSPDVATLCKQLSSSSATWITDISEFHVSNTDLVTMALDNGFLAECDVEQLKNALPAVSQAVQYFVSKGYPPGTIDLSGPPPYLYTPFAKSGSTGERRQ